MKQVTSVSVNPDVAFKLKRTNNKLEIGVGCFMGLEMETEESCLIESQNDYYGSSDLQPAAAGLESDTDNIGSYATGNVGTTIGSCSQLIPDATDNVVTEDGTARSRSERARWTDSQNRFLLVFLKELKRVGSRNSWDQVARVMKAILPNSNLTIPRLKQKVQDLHKLYNKGKLSASHMKNITYYAQLAALFEEETAGPSIALGVVKGFAFLHNVEGPLINRDLKPSNILLDSAYSYTSKLSDFGLSKVAQGDETHVSTHVMHTIGYVDPQYMTGTIWNSSQKASWNGSEMQFLLHLLECFRRARRGGWSEDTWKMVPQVMKEIFPMFNFTIEQLKQLVMLYNQVSQMSMQPGFIWDNKNCLLQAWRDCYQRLEGEGSMNNLNSSSTIPLSMMLGNLQIHPVNLQSCAPLSIKIPPCGVSFLNNHEDKRVSNIDCGMGNVLILSAPLHPIPASKSHQPEKHKQDSFPRKKPTRKFRGKPKCKKMRDAKSGFSLKRCMKMLKNLQEFKECDMELVGEIFSDALYREAFIAMKKSQKVFWLRSKIDEGKENRSVDHSVGRTYAQN